MRASADRRIGDGTLPVAAVTRVVVTGPGDLVAPGIWWRLSDANDQLRVCLKRLICSIENGGLGHGLGYEQPVKRIAMKGGKLGDPQRSSRSDWQLRKPAFQCSMHNCVWSDLEVSAAQGMLYRYFPDAGCAEQHLMLRILENGAR
jgi:hypothetical protein